MCGGVYEEELKDDTKTDQERIRKPMGDIKFMTAGDFIKEQEEAEDDRLD